MVKEAEEIRENRERERSRIIAKNALEEAAYEVKAKFEGDQRNKNKLKKSQEVSFSNAIVNLDHCFI